MRSNNRIFYILFYFTADCKQVFTMFWSFNLQHWNRLLANIVNKSFLYFENVLRKETKISIETNFTSFDFIYHSKCCFRLYYLPSWKLAFPFVCFFKIISWKNFRRSRLQMFFKIGALKNFANFTGKHLCWSLFLIQLQA